MLCVQNLSVGQRCVSSFVTLASSCSHLHLMLVITTPIQTTKPPKTPKVYPKINTTIPFKTDMQKKCENHPVYLHINFVAFL